MSPRTLVSPSPRFGATVMKTPLKATIIPKVFANREAFAGNPEMREECREKGIDVNKDSGAGCCCEFGAGVQTDNLEYENHCQQHQSRQIHRGVDPVRHGETATNPPTTTRPITKRKNANAIGGKSCKPTFIEGEFPPQRNARSRLRAMIFPCGSSLITFGVWGVFRVVSGLYSKVNCCPHRVVGQLLFSEGRGFGINRRHRGGGYPLNAVDVLSLAPRLLRRTETGSDKVRKFLRDHPIRLMHLQ